jgi:hypothetical protein
MKTLWGPTQLVQSAPHWIPDREPNPSASTKIAPSASVITADITHDNRYKGLLWYSTFTVDFQASYTIPALPDAGGVAAEGCFIFPLPGYVTSYDDLQATLDGEPVEVYQPNVAKERIVVPVTRDVEHLVAVRYIAGGQDEWLYAPGEPRKAKKGVVAARQMAQLENFRLTVTTDFADIDYPKGTRSPTSPAKKVDGGMTATWQYPNARTSQAMGIAMPKRPNAGPIVARMSFFAPVSLFFFFTVLFTVVVIKKIPLHPMHYLFISAGFFAFHILLAYLADLVSIHVAFWIAGAVSVFLVATYMRLVAGVKFTLLYVCGAQLAYLIGFSYAFFWVGRTGLTVTIGAVLTLFILMQATGRIKWHEAFEKRGRYIDLASPGQTGTAPPPLPSAGVPQGPETDN